MTSRDEDTTQSPRQGATGRARPKALAFAALALVVLFGLWFAISSTLALGGSTARAEIEARLSELTGQPVFVDGRSDFTLLPRPRLEMSDVVIGGTEPGEIITIDRVRAELDLVDALVGRADIANLILIRPELAHLAQVPPRSDGAAPLAPAVAPQDPAAPTAPEAHGAIVYARSLLERFEGVRNLELRDGAFRPRDESMPVTNVNLRMNWVSRADPVHVVGSFVWNGQPAEIDTRLSDPVPFLAGETSGLRFALTSPSLSLGFEGAGASGEAVSFDGTLRMASPSLARAARWFGSNLNVPDIGAVSIETRIVHDGNTRTAMDPVRVGVGDQTGTGIIEAVFAEGRRPVFTGTLAFPELDLDQFASGIAPLPRHAFDLQRPMAVSFVENFDLDLRVSAADAGLGTMPLRQLAASLMFSGATATLDIGDAEVFGGRAQGRLVVDLTGSRPMARGRIDLTDVDAQGLGGVSGLRSVAMTGRANLTAQFEAPATSWAEVLRDNSTTARLTLSSGTITGLSPAMFLEAGERPLAVEPSGAAVPFNALEARFGTRGPYATLDRLTLAGPAGLVEAGGFLSLLDDRIFVEGAFTPPESVEGNDPFTTSQLVPFKMQGQWPVPTLSVGDRLNFNPI